jgi:hypothetical protein
MVAKRPGPRTSGSSMGPHAQGLKTLKMYLSAKYNYLNIFICMRINNMQNTAQ